MNLTNLRAIQLRLVLGAISFIALIAGSVALVSLHIGSPTTASTPTPNLHAQSVDCSKLRRTASVVAPTPRHGEAFAYDPLTCSDVMFGGSPLNVPSGGELDQTWEWTADGWVQLHPAHSPGPLVNAAMGFDPASGDMVLVAGTRAILTSCEGQTAIPASSTTPQCFRPTTTDNNNTWGWNGNDWKLLANSGPVGDLFYDYNLRLVTDTASRQLLEVTAERQLVSGQGQCYDIPLVSGHARSCTAKNDKIEGRTVVSRLESGGWTRVATFSTAPLAFDVPEAVATDPAVIFLANRTTDTSGGLPISPAEWNGTAFAILPGTLSANIWGAAADTTNGDVVLYGENGGETYSWVNGRAIRLAQPHTLPATNQIGAVMVEGPDGTALLYDAEDTLPDPTAVLYRWNGSSWAVATAVQPSPLIPSAPRSSTATPSPATSDSAVPVTKLGDT